MYYVELHKGSLKGSNWDETYALYSLLPSFLLERRGYAWRRSRDMGQVGPRGQKSDAGLRGPGPQALLSGGAV